MQRTAIRGLLFLLLLPCLSKAQSLINTTGTTVKTNDFILEYSIGEIGITTLSTSPNFITQGLLQPGLKITEPDCPIINDTLNYFPNPTREILSVVTRRDWITSYRIYAADGKLVRAAFFINNQINMADLASGVYFIKLFPGCNDKYRILKAIKSN